nr:mediator of RNA polymerase II transcription subunit 14-like [Tanacetum cinerariifolium]
MWRILHLEVLVGETSGPAKLEEMRRFVLEDDLELLPVLCKRVKMEKLILLVYALQEIKYFTAWNLKKIVEHQTELGENSHIRRAGGYVLHMELNEPCSEDNK